eukprot:6612814-Prorocentrum_lima.AAC.1
MTSSLVGSEMCIRDSPECAGELPKVGRSRCYFTCREVWKSAECITLHDGCLLYTSDAADDM